MVEKPDAVIVELLPLVGLTELPPPPIVIV
jgi:hypothetical protein